ncbi:hypothetical protein [Polaribacter sp. R77954]|uniref:hypothetical protein n=1 Tax=Polaribacter sp. R77954 TaxID=3093870 RepID=UPI0037CACB2B
MKSFKYALLILCSSILCFCEGQIGEEGIEGTIVCNFSNLEISEADNIVIADNTAPVLWQGYYSDDAVTINFTKKLDNYGLSETLNFVFTKVDNCLQINRGFEFYNGGTGDISAITEVDVLEFYVKDWQINKKLAGQVVYRDHHDKLVKTLNFWLEFTTEDYVVTNTDYKKFSNCFGDKLPIDIDLDNDGVTDYSIRAEEVIDFANRPNFVAYNIKLVSTDEEINEILSPKGVSIPFPVIFEPPFSTENTRSYAANKFNSLDVKNSLDVFYEFSAPYENYNFFLQNNLTYKKEFENTIDDYYAVKLVRNNENYYGWIKIDFNALDCNIAVLDTYLSPNAEEHINIEN